MSVIASSIKGSGFIFREGVSSPPPPPPPPPPPDPNYRWNPLSPITSSITPVFSDTNSLFEVSASPGPGTNFGTRSGTAISGKVYCEFELMTQTNDNNFHGFGIVDGSVTTISPYGTLTYNIYSRAPTSFPACGFAYAHAANINGTDYAVPSFAAYSFGIGDRIGIAIDMTAMKIWFSKNGAWITGDPAAGTGETASVVAGTYYFAFLNYTCNVFTPIDISAKIYPAASTQLYSAPSGFSPYAVS